MPVNDHEAKCGCVYGLRIVCVEHCGGHAIANPRAPHQDPPVGADTGDPAREKRWASGDGGYQVFRWMRRWSWRFVATRDGYESMSDAENAARDHECQLERVMQERDDARRIAAHQWATMYDGGQRRGATELFGAAEAARLFPDDKDGST